MGLRLKGIGVSVGEGFDRMVGSGFEVICRGSWGETVVGRRNFWCRGGFSYLVVNVRGLWG